MCIEGVKATQCGLCIAKRFLQNDPLRMAASFAAPKITLSRQILHASMRVQLIIYGTMTIEVYCGDPEAPVNEAEQRVLARIIGILRQRGEAAVVLTNVPCDKRECDLLVSTGVTTLVLEVKCYKHPVAGAIDDAMWINPYTGVREDNPCRQVRHTMLALKDALRGFVGQDPGYPRCAVVFDGGLAPGSAVQDGTDRIAIASDNDLEALLAWPLDERNKTRRWPLELLRRWAFERGMDQVDPPVPATRYPHGRPPVTLEARQAIQHSTAPIIVEAHTERRANWQRRFWPIVAVVLAAIAIGQWWRLHQRPSANAPITLARRRKERFRDIAVDIRRRWARSRSHRLLRLRRFSGVSPR